MPQADTPNPRWLIPRPRYVPAYGSGYALRGAGSAVWRRRDIQGHWLGSSPHVLNPEGAGFAFPVVIKPTLTAKDVLVLLGPSPNGLRSSPQNGTVSLKVAAEQVRDESLSVVFAPELDPGIADGLIWDVMIVKRKLGGVFGARLSVMSSGS